MSPAPWDNVVQVVYSSPLKSVNGLNLEFPLAI
jgi:hypothetical protein